MPDVCDSRKVTAPDGRDIPIPLGELQIATDPNTGESKTVNIPAEASVQVAVNDAGQYYVAINAAGPSNDEASDKFKELITEGSLKVVETLAEEAFAEAGVDTVITIGLAGAVGVEVSVVALAAFLVGQLISVLTPSNLTREIFIRGNLRDDNAPITYCLLVDPE